jgi:hypothetical protein
MFCDQFGGRARKGPGLPLDINDPQHTGAVGLAHDAFLEPPLEDLNSLHRIAEARVAPVKPVENMEFVWPPRRAGNRIDRRHAAAGMRRQDQTVDIQS